MDSRSGRGGQMRPLRKAPYDGQIAVSVPAGLAHDEDLILARRLELASGGTPIGITNRVGSGNDKQAHFGAMPSGPSAAHPDRPKGPGPNDRGAQYHATTDPEKIREWSRQYPDCVTFIGGILPDDVGCIDIDRADEFRLACPGMFERLQERGHPTDKRIGKDRWHIWVRLPDGRKAKELGDKHPWGEIKWSGGLVVSGPSATYESIIPLVAWKAVPRLTDSDIRAIRAGGTPSEFSAPPTASTGRHPGVLAISASMAGREGQWQEIIDEVWAVDRRSVNPAHNVPARQGGFAAGVERMVVDGAMDKYRRNALAAALPTMSSKSAIRLSRRSKPMRPW